MLGVDIGNAVVRNKQFLDTAEAVAAGREKISVLGDVAELVLIRRCGDVCKVTLLLRAHGPNLEADA